ncbi:MAG TPA: phosphoribosylanthranilate isomerase [Chitinispirillaceae bacterium]|nr:phosphoribosylanthranilate isomerase [Chitinispirillaceae bacterium]
MSTRIKICGITRLEDAKVAANLGVDALGFIFYQKSPRFVMPEQAANIIMQLPPMVNRVGVFVNENYDNIMKIVRQTGIDTVQLHGDETPDFCSSIPLPVIKSFSVRPQTDLSELKNYKTQGILLDTWSGQMQGGTGKTFDWNIARKACVMFKNVVLAGGLGPTNLEDALKIVDPFAVDINSGVEIMPGVKNPHKIRDVVKIVRNWKKI